MKKLLTLLFILALTASVYASWPSGGDCVDNCTFTGDTIFLSDQGNQFMIADMLGLSAGKCAFLLDWQNVGDNLTETGACGNTATYDDASDFTSAARSTLGTSYVLTFDGSNDQVTVADADILTPIDRIYIDDAENDWDGTATGGITSAVNADKKVGTYSVLITIPAGASANDYDSNITPTTDLSSYPGVGFWIKSTQGTSYGNLRLLLDETNTWNSKITLVPLQITDWETIEFIYS